jgi:MFS family permease
MNGEQIPPREVTRLRDLSPQQWKSGIAAWLGWLFDGFDFQLYILVATPFVAELLKVEQKDPRVGQYGSIIQAGFLIGWALGGGFFGRIADRIGRSRALSLTILTYALFTGLSTFAQTWWQMLIFRFISALGIGGEWAVGASLLSETWPKRWRPWMAAVLQTGVNLGVLFAGRITVVWSQLEFKPRTVFLVGVLPALLVLWIRRAVPEPEEWHTAKKTTAGPGPRFLDLFRGPVRRITILTLLVCALTLTAHWAFNYWFIQHLWQHPDFDGWPDLDKSKVRSMALTTVMISSIAGNFLAALIARFLRYRIAIAALSLTYFVSMLATYSTPLSHNQLWPGFVCIGLSQGIFALFTMYMPPLFPTLLRTTGAGFCYNIGRIAAGLGTVFFGALPAITGVGSLSNADDFRMSLLYAGFLFLPAAAIALLLPEPPDEKRKDQP